MHHAPLIKEKKACLPDWPETKTERSNIQFQEAINSVGMVLKRGSQSGDNDQRRESRNKFEVSLDLAAPLPHFSPVNRPDAYSACSLLVNAS